MTALQNMIESAKEFGIDDCYIVIEYRLYEKKTNSPLDSDSEKIENIRKEL